MLKLDRVTKFKMLFLVLVFVFNFDVPKFSAAILEKGLLPRSATGLRLIACDWRCPHQLVTLIFTEKEQFI